MNEERWRGVALHKLLHSCTFIRFSAVAINIFRLVLVHKKLV
jgi:hypothetical protein